MRVVYYQRKPAANRNYSIESYFENVRSLMPADVETVVATSSFDSRGVARRALSIAEAAFRQGDVNHITGDVHFLSFALRKAITVLTVHDCGSLRRTSGLRREILRQIWFEQPSRRVAAITVNSEATKQDLLRFVSCDPALVTVIPVFISPDFVHAPKPFDAARPRILQIGTAANKNIERLAEALRGLRCTLHIVGTLDDRQTDALRRFGVEYTNSVGLTNAQLRAEYAASDIVAFASTWEGFGMPIVEANAVGRPVVTSNLASMPEVGRDAACYVDPYDPASIRAGLVRVLDDAEYRQQLVVNGFENRKRFRPDSIARDYYNLYSQLFERSLRTKLYRH